MNNNNNAKPLALKIHLYELCAIADVYTDVIIWRDTLKYPIVQFWSNELYDAKKAEFKNKVSHAKTNVKYPKSICTDSVSIQYQSAYIIFANMCINVCIILLIMLVIFFNNVCIYL